MQQCHEETEETAVRRRILEAAFSAFREPGYAGTSTLEIATRAHVSKREPYALVGNKDELLAACIGARAKRLHVPADLPMPRDRETLEQTLAFLGALLLREISDPMVIGVFRLAIAEAVRAPELARTLDSIGRATSRAALRAIIDQARLAGLLEGQPSEMAEQFSGLLWGNLMVSLLLGVADRPSAHEITRRARDATVAQPASRSSTSIRGSARTAMPSRSSTDGATIPALSERDHGSGRRRHPFMGAARYLVRSMAMD